MRAAVQCSDRAGTVDKRLANYEAHKAHPASGVVETVIAGPRLMADGETMIGSLFVFEGKSVAAVEAFNQADRCDRAGVWAQVSIRAFNPRVDNRD